jgi:hypothetical protein
MADDESIYVDAGEPALLHDGSVHTEYHTVADAKTAWDRLPPARRRSAAIETNRHVYKEQQINRQHYGPNPMAVDAALSFVDVAPNFSARDAPWRLIRAHTMCQPLRPRWPEQRPLSQRLKFGQFHARTLPRLWRCQRQVRLRCSAAFRR